ncbi:hypothetical protein H2199_000077 [Coniosporium tulheliwenetii]|uniref:Uncharacterized protein n=1 Tax=Coniosporium tulheliwenetii TaxID=3383036 RepID=A0ACC2ZP41_9PEZI|nr:hypothetical protein H2199_000077 [Cladosporium sp. JES 115]
MPCDDPTHNHVWPTSGNLTIYHCEKYCGYCSGQGKADGKFAQTSHLRAHVKTKHIKHFKDVKVLPGVMGKDGKLPPQSFTHPSDNAMTVDVGERSVTPGPSYSFVPASAPPVMQSSRLLQGAINAPMQPSFGHHRAPQGFQDRTSLASWNDVNQHHSNIFPHGLPSAPTQFQQQDPLHGFAPFLTRQDQMQSLLSAHTSNGSMNFRAPSFNTRFVPIPQNQLEDPFVGPSSSPDDIDYLRTVFTPRGGYAGSDLGALPESPLASRSRSFDGFPTQQDFSPVTFRSTRSFGDMPLSDDWEDHFMNPMDIGTTDTSMQNPPLPPRLVARVNPATAFRTGLFELVDEMNGTTEIATFFPRPEGGFTSAQDFFRAQLRGFYNAAIGTGFTDEEATALMAAELEALRQGAATTAMTPTEADDDEDDPLTISVRESVEEGSPFA